jgi:lipopolysaccharide biosynthesis regulator YciM
MDDLTQELYSVLKEMVDHLPQRRDWLDPVTEARAKQVLLRTRMMDPKQVLPKSISFYCTCGCTIMTNKVEVDCPVCNRIWDTSKYPHLFCTEK